MSSATSKRRQVLRDIYNYEIYFKYLGGQFTEGIQNVYPEPDYIHYTVIGVTVGLSVLNLFKRSVYSHNQFLSVVNWGGVHDTLHMPPEKKSRGIKSGDHAGHAKQRRPFSMDGCKQLLV
jgi:hypothetical protein